MSWQEKVERYKAEQKAKQEEKELKEKIEKQETLNELFGILDQLQVKEKLGQIRNELWGLGEIYTRSEIRLKGYWPGEEWLNWLDPQDLIEQGKNAEDLFKVYEVTVILSARWGRYKPAYYTQERISGDESEEVYRSATVKSVGTDLVVEATLRVMLKEHEPDEDKISIVVGGEYFSMPRRGFNLQESINRLKELFLKDCAKRELPYTNQRQIDNDEIIRAIRNFELSDSYYPKE